MYDVFNVRDVLYISDKKVLNLLRQHLIMQQI